MSRWLDVNKLEDYTGISASTWNKRRGTGDGPQFAKIAGRVLYDVADVDAYLEQHKRSSTADSGSGRAGGTFALSLLSGSSSSAGSRSRALSAGRAPLCLRVQSCAVCSGSRTTTTYDSKRAG